MSPASTATAWAITHYLRCAQVDAGNLKCDRRPRCPASPTWHYPKYPHFAQLHALYFFLCSLQRQRGQSNLSPHFARLLGRFLFRSPFHLCFIATADSRAQSTILVLAGPLPIDTIVKTHSAGCLAPAPPVEADDQNCISTKNGIQVKVPVANAMGRGPGGR